MALGNSFTQADEGLFYSKSDEKFTVRALLDEILENKKFNHALDVGPGHGHISEPLATRSRHLTMVERLPECEEALRARFDNANVIINDIEQVELVPHYDAILFAHVLYYVPEERWLPLLRKLYGLLVPGGELILVLNSDSGDWWQIISHYWQQLREHIAFHYIPLSQFKKELAEFGHLHIYPYRYQLWTEPGASWPHFVGRQLLEIGDETVLREQEAGFNSLASKFKHVDGCIVLDFRAEVLRLRKGE